MPRFFLFFPGAGIKDHPPDGGEHEDYTEDSHSEHRARNINATEYDNTYTTD